MIHEFVNILHDKCENDAVQSIQKFSKFFIPVFRKCPYGFE